MNQRDVVGRGRSASGRVGVRERLGRAAGGAARLLWRRAGISVGGRVDPLESRILMAATDVVINEIMFNSATSESADEYVELYNKGTTPVNITGWKLTKGVDYTFGNTTLAAGQYLVGAANLTRFGQKYPTVTNRVGPWVGQLSNSGEDVRLVTNTGVEIDRVDYADDGAWAVRRRGPLDNQHMGWEWVSAADGLGKSLELINPNLSNNRGQNWGPSTPDNGTPGAANSIAAANVAPIIDELSHFPVVPRATEQVTVTAKVDDELTSGLTVQVFHRKDGAANFTAAAMFDDGLHGDGSANDGVYGAVLPAQSNRTVVEFYVRATDAAGNARTWPGPTDAAGAQQANALYQVDDAAYAGKQPLFKLIMTEAERVELDQIGNGQGAASNAAMNGTFISTDGAGTDVRYTVGFRNRGGGSRVAAVSNYRVNFTDADPWHGQARINLNATWSTSEVAAAALAARAGVAAQRATPVQVRVNAANLATAGNGMFGSYSWVEDEDGEYVKRHFPTDDGGNLYSGVDGGHRAHLSTGTYNPALYPKGTNVEENDYSDLEALVAALNAGTATASYVANVEAILDVDQWLRYFAFNALVGNYETSLGTGVGDDYGLYRGTNDGRFKILAHDMDSILTLGENPAGINVNTSIFRPTNLATVRGLLTHPDFAPRYFKQVKDLAENVFAAGELGRVLHHALGGYVAAGTIDNAVNNGVARAAAALAQVPAALAVTTTPAANAGYPRVTNAAQLAAMTLGGGANALVTKSILVNGREAAYTPWRGTWTIANAANTLGLTNGLNRVVVQALGAGGVEVGRTFVDVWYQNGAGTNVSGTMAGNVVWSPQNGPYRVTGNVTVNAGATLTIRPGTTVYFGDNTKLTVSGTLNAVGTDPNGTTNSGHIRFSHDPVNHNTNTASWLGVHFLNSMQANRLTYVDLEFMGLNGNPSTQLHGSSVDMDHVTWSRPGSNSVIVQMGASITDRNSISLTNSVIPSAVNAEVLLLYGQITATGKAIIQGNVFGTTTGHNDIIDFTGPNRPGPIFQILDNVFTGTGTGGTVADDILDIDGTDAHIEGNVFMNVQPSPTSDTNSAISGGRDTSNAATGTNRSEIVSERNFFYNVDHAFLMKEGNSIRSINDTMVKVGTGVFNFDEPGFAATKGQGGYVDGGVFFDIPVGVGGNPVIVENGPAGVFEIRRSITASANPIAGVANLNIDPRLLNTAAVLDPRVDFALRPFSAAIGAGPNGKDMGAAVPAGASVSGEPAGVSPFNTATLRVGGPAIFAYQWRLDNGAWSAAVPVSNPMSNAPVVPNIVLNNLTNGTHRVSVVVQNDAGVWQSTNAATLSKLWTVNAAIAGRVRINEVLADNGGVLVNGTTTPDAIELYNDGKGAIDLSDFGISDDPLVPRKFVFPAGTTLAQGQYLVVYADSASAAPGLHLGFSLSENGEGVYLSNKPSAGGGLVDSVTFGTQLENLSVGRVGDGTTWGLTRPTLGAANASAPTGDPATLRINEWQAAGAPPFSADFVELYNPDPLPVAIGGMFVTDNLAGWPTHHAIAPLSFAPAGGYLKLTADDDTVAGANHLSFQLDHDRGEIAVLDASQRLVDFVLYDTQADGVSEGLLPNGTGEYTFFNDPTPGLANAVGNPGTSTSPLRITELMYNAPGDAANAGDEYEYVELQNTGPNPINLNNFRFSAGVDFTFGDVTLPAGGRVVIVKNLAAFTARYGTGINVAGQYGDSLDNGGEVVRLLDNAGLTVQEFTFAPTWYDSTDGGGNALVAVDARQERALFNTAAGWRASVAELGTPGVAESALADGAVVVNEVLANAPAGSGEWLELRNTTAAAIDVGGWYLSDSATHLLKFRIPFGTVIPAGGFVWFSESSTYGSPQSPTAFSLSSTGDDVFLSSATALGVLGGYREGAHFGASELGVTHGRHTTSTGAVRFVALARATRGAANSAPRVGPVVINEVMYHPESTKDEFVELKNVSPNAVSLAGWQFTSGITFTFPAGTTLAPGAIMIVAPNTISAADFRTKYAVPAAVQVLSGYTGGLSNGGEEVELSKPGAVQPDLSVPMIVVDEVDYGTASPWPAAADGTGPSLSRFVEGGYGDDPANWRASAALGGTPGAVNDSSPVTAIGQFVQGPTHQLKYVFGKNVGPSLAAGDLVLRNLTTGVDIAPTTIAGAAYDPAGNVGTFTFPGQASGRLPRGRYRATLSGTGVNAGGVNLDGNGDGTAGDSYVFEFVHLPGDLNGDERVTLADYQLLERNFGKTGATWADGDFDYNGVVDTADLKVVLANMNVSLAGPAGAGAVAPEGAPAPVTSTPVTPVPVPVPTPTPTPAKPVTPAPRKPVAVVKPAAAVKPAAVTAVALTSPFSATRIVKKRDAAGVLG